jgi:hypothetical protein
MKFRYIVLMTALVLFASIGKSFAQMADIYVMSGSDVTRPGLSLRANLNAGFGYNLKAINNKIAGDELTFSYTYENAGSHGFWHTSQGAHTESLGLLHSVAFGKSRYGLYLWPQLGITSLTNQQHGTENRLFEAEALGFTYKIKGHNNIWFQEQYNKVETQPWYTSTSLGYDYSF